MIFKGHIILNVDMEVHEKETYIKLFQENFTMNDILLL